MSTTSEPQLDRQPARELANENQHQERPLLCTEPFSIMCVVNRTTICAYLGTASQHSAPQDLAAVASCAPVLVLGHPPGFNGKKQVADGRPSY